MCEKVINVNTYSRIYYLLLFHFIASTVFHSTRIHITFYFEFHVLFIYIHKNIHNRKIKGKILMEKLFVDFTIKFIYKYRNDFYMFYVFPIIERINFIFVYSYSYTYTRYTYIMLCLLFCFAFLLFTYINIK